MTRPSQKSTWEDAYRKKLPTERSWTQDIPSESLHYIDQLSLPSSTPIIDVGGGSSHLAEQLLSRNFTDISVLDISDSALHESKLRIEQSHPNQKMVQWIAADITMWSPPRTYGLWHDRAVFHFLVDTQQQKQYVQTVESATQSGAYVIMGTFALDGPEMCSGLSVQRWSSSSLAAMFADNFSTLESRVQPHITPWGSTQSFTWLVLQRN
jgi:hypothetical protein